MSETSRQIDATIRGALSPEVEAELGLLGGDPCIVVVRLANALSEAQRERDEWRAMEEARTQERNAARDSRDLAVKQRDEARAEAEEGGRREDAATTKWHAAESELSRLRALPDQMWSAWLECWGGPSKALTWLPIHRGARWCRRWLRREIVGAK